MALSDPKSTRVRYAWQKEAGRDSYWLPPCCCCSDVLSHSIHSSHAQMMHCACLQDVVLSDSEDEDDEWEYAEDEGFVAFVQVQQCDCIVCVLLPGQC